MLGLVEGFLTRYEHGGCSGTPRLKVWKIFVRVEGTAFWARAALALRYPLWRVWPARARRAWAIISVAMSRSSALAGASAKAIGSPDGVATRWKRSPQK